MRKFLFALILLLGIIFIIARISEFGAIINTLQKGDFRFLLLAAILQALWICNVAASFQSIYTAIGISIPLSEMFLISSAVNFANVAAPSGGVSGVAILIDHSRRKGYSSALAAIANTLYIEFDLLGFLTILALGIFVLNRRDSLTISVITAATILLGISLLLSFLLYLGTKSASALEKALVFLAHLVNRILKPFIHRDYLSINRAHTFASEAAEGLRRLRQDPKKIIAPALWGFTSKILLLTIFTTMFLAFKVPVSPGTLVAGFSIAFLFLLVSPTPAGLGFVEGAVTLALTSMYVPLSTAVVITIAYRAYSFWLPLMVGMICFRTITMSSPKDVIKMS